jgi:hypothetical protein
MASELGYAPLPERVAELAMSRWNSITCGPDNQPVLAK